MVITTWMVITPVHPEEDLTSVLALQRTTYRHSCGILDILWWFYVLQVVFWTWVNLLCSFTVVECDGWEVWTYYVFRVMLLIMNLYDLEGHVFCYYIALPCAMCWMETRVVASSVLACFWASLCTNVPSTLLFMNVMCTEIWMSFGWMCIYWNVHLLYSSICNAKSGLCS
jgi:hypothetical protein